MTRTALYRHFDASGALLYVGISNQLGRRTDHHLKSSPWADQIASIAIEWHETRDAAELAERSAISYQKPLQNKQCQIAKPEHDMQVLQSDTARDALIKVIDEYALRAGMKPTTIGQYAVKNRRFYQNLITGSGYQVQVARRLLDWIAARESAVSDVR